MLKDRVLYEYRAPQDVCALYSLPVLGYQVEAFNKVRMTIVLLAVTDGTVIPVSP